MSTTGWNTTDLILANKARNIENHHIKYDGLVWEQKQIKKTIFIFLGFLKNIIKAGVQNWFNDIDRYVDEYHGTPNGYHYSNGYRGGRSYRY